jgi:microcompartment protein CcmL/EutN
MLDIADVPRGLAALDAIAKEAPVQIVSAGTVQPGRYLILFAGEVEAVERSFTRALHRVGDAIVDMMLLPWAEERILPAIHPSGGPALRWPQQGDALGVLQNGSSPTLLTCVDAALKGALVDLVELRVAEGLGGGATAMLWGETADVEAAIELARSVSGRGRADGFSAEIIRNADPEVGRAVSGGTRFFGQWRG